MASLVPSGHPEGRPRPVGPVRRQRGGRHAVIFNKRTKLLGYPLLDDTGSLKLRPRAPAVVATSPADVASPLRDSLPCGGVKKTHKIVVLALLVWAADHPQKTGSVCVGGVRYTCVDSVGPTA